MADDDGHEERNPGLRARCGEVWETIDEIIVDTDHDSVAHTHLVYAIHYIQKTLDELREGPVVESNLDPPAPPVSDKEGEDAAGSKGSEVGDPGPDDFSADDSDDIDMDEPTNGSLEDSGDGLIETK